MHFAVLWGRRGEIRLGLPDEIFSKPMIKLITRQSRAKQPEVMSVFSRICSRTEPTWQSSHQRTHGQAAQFCWRISSVVGCCDSLPLNLVRFQWLKLALLP